MLDLIVPNIICLQTQKQLTSLNNIRVLLKSVLTDLHVRNFVRAKTSLRARPVHACHRTRILSSPVHNIIQLGLLICYVVISFMFHNK